MRGGCENEVRDNELGKEYRVEIWQEWSLIIEYWWLEWYNFPIIQRLGELLYGTRD